MSTSTSLEHSVARLDRIVEDACTERSYLGVFPAMYRRVTASVLEAIRSGGFFDDDELVERMTVIFADLYFEAYDLHRAGEKGPGCWAVAFETAESPSRRMILQHLLLGMNAHINLDLGVATWRAAGTDLERIKADFIRVNEILFQVLDGIQAGMGAVSPRMHLVDRLGGAWDERIMMVGIRTCRNLAWSFAEELIDSAAPAEAVSRRDIEAEWVARAMVRRWSPFNMVAGVVARAESRDILAVVDSIGRHGVDLEAADRAARAVSPSELTLPRGTSLARSTGRAVTFGPGGRRRVW